jgi:hypothetical protein
MYPPRQGAPAPNGPYEGVPAHLYQPPVQKKVPRQAGELRHLAM